MVRLFSKLLLCVFALTTGPLQAQNYCQWLYYRVFGACLKKQHQEDHPSEDELLQAAPAPFKDALKKYYKDLKKKRWGAVAHMYITQFQQEEQELCDEFLLLIGYTPEQWEMYKAKNDIFFKEQEDQDRKKIASTTHLVPTKLRLTINSFLKKSHINPQDISIGMLQELEVAMRVTQTTIEISKDSESDSHHIDDETKAVIMHEIQHLLHNDYYNAYMMQWCADELKNKENKEKIKAVLFKLDRLHEKRADILGCLTDSNFAKSYKRTHETSVIVGDCVDYSKNEHDAPVVCAAYMKKLYREMTHNGRL